MTWTGGQELNIGRKPSGVKEERQCIFPDCKERGKIVVWQPGASYDVVHEPERIPERTRELPLCDKHFQRWSIKEMELSQNDSWKHATAIERTKMEFEAMHQEEEEDLVGESEYD